ncbi:hypothetical protein HGM15179_007244 [Zosterops borbonicus]|uniref:CCHC-type domain-containing protein n=1 Tax=Zosterops borbonicus TaxID=364589 RepID=A0A8K1LN96_9PASS|nr:hypothetical protein HGM15179_007244 [Zosterops borbonicus]
MVSPQAQAQGLRASEIAATTRAARETICTACRIVAKPSPWTTIRQTESERFTTFVDRLQAAIDASDLPSEAKGPVLEGCLRQQCNQSTKELLRSVPPGASIATMIKHVVKEENLAPVQAAVNAVMAPLPAAVGAAVAEIMVVQNHNIHSQPLSTNLPLSRPRGPCWICGRKGHIARCCAHNKKQGKRQGRGQPGRMRLPPRWESQRPSYLIPTGTEHLPSSLPPRELTNFIAQAMPNITTQTSPPQTPTAHGDTKRQTRMHASSAHATDNPRPNDIPRVALAINCDTQQPPIVWGVCRPAHRPDDCFVTLPFTVDTGSNVTVIPNTHWPPSWQLEDTTAVVEVGGIQRAQKSIDLISITIYSQDGIEKPVSVHVYVLSNTPPLLGRDAQALLGVKVTNLPLGPLRRTRRSQLD